MIGRYIDGTMKNRANMCIIGVTSDGYEVYINIDDERETPHFHYAKKYDWDSFHACIKIDAAKYFFHEGDENCILSTEQKKDLIDFLKSRPKSSRYNTNWDLLIAEWGLYNYKIANRPKLLDYNLLEGEYIMPERYDDGSTKDYTEMARVGFTKNGYEVYINTNDEGKVPHFHYRKAGNWRLFNTCIKIESPEYFYHGNNQEILSLEQKNDLIDFLSSNPKDGYFDTKWEFLISMWNMNNADVEIDCDLKMPDYSLL